jgi:hypothetical protein
MLDVALTLRSAILLVGRPAPRASVDTPSRVIFRPLPDRSEDDRDPAEAATLVALLGGYRRFI